MTPTVILSQPMKDYMNFKYPRLTASDLNNIFLNAEVREIKTMFYADVGEYLSIKTKRVNVSDIVALHYDIPFELPYYTNNEGVCWDIKDEVRA